MSGARVARAPRQHVVLVRLAQLDRGEAERVGDVAVAAQDGRGLLELVCGQWFKRMFCHGETPSCPRSGPVPLVSHALHKRMDDHQLPCDDTPRRRHGRRKDRLCSRGRRAPKLKTISEIRSFFRTNTRPIFFVGPTGFNLLGIDRWVRNFQYLVYYDSWDGAHPGCSRRRTSRTSSSRVVSRSTTTCSATAEVQAHVASRAGLPGGAMVAMVFFDEETEQICEELGYELILPTDSLRSAGLQDRHDPPREEAGAPSVPNVLGRAESYRELSKLATDAGLGSDLVVQTPYGDSGKTTFFIKAETDWDANAEYMIDEELKVMRRIRNRAAAVEAVNTRHGTVVGPFMTDLTGYPN